MCVKAGAHAVRVYQYGNILWIADGKFLGLQLRTIGSTAKKAVSTWQNAAVKRRISPFLGWRRANFSHEGRGTKVILGTCSPCTRGGNEMLKKLALAMAAVGLLMSTASADYYIVQEKATKKCKVVETRPTETTWIQIGPAAFKTQAEAEKQVKTVCVEKR
jgi:hypothetical protein